MSGDSGNENRSRFYKLGIEIEKITQRLGYAADTVRGWVGKEKE